MLTMDSKILAILGGRQRVIFRERLEIHLKKCWPLHVAPLQDEGLAYVIDHGLSRAAHHGLTGERDIVRYFDCMALLGAEFDVDSDSGWAAYILASKPLSAAAKMARIWQRAKSLALQAHAV